MIPMVCHLLIILTKNRLYFAILFNQRPFYRDFLKKWGLFCNCLTSKCLCSGYTLGGSGVSLLTLSSRLFDLIISVV